MTLQQLRYAIMVADQHSMNKAAEKLFITQPSLSNSIRELENELGIEIFIRSNRGVTLTPEGEEFLGYARQMMEHYRLITDRFVSKSDSKEKFSVSAQHYSFAVEAFIKLVREYGFGKYEFAMHETKTGEVIDNVKTLKSEVGVLYENDFNRAVLEKIFRRDELEFVPLFDCHICVFLTKNHPLAGQKKIRMEQLEDYPCCSFEQGDNNSFYFSEEVMSTYDYKKMLKADDRATFLNFMVGLNAYTLCSGLICEELNGEEYTAIPLDTDETMTIGYIKIARMPLSPIAQKYVGLLEKYRDNVVS
jgi:DNA-binding transcriptional LysR family regulator